MNNGWCQIWALPPVSRRSRDLFSKPSKFNKPICKHITIRPKNNLSETISIHSTRFKLTWKLLLGWCILLDCSWINRYTHHTHRHTHTHTKTSNEIMATLFFWHLIHQKVKEKTAPNTNFVTNCCNRICLDAMRVCFGYVF